MLLVGRGDCVCIFLLATIVFCTLLMCNLLTILLFYLPAQGLQVENSNLLKPDTLHLSLFYIRLMFFVHRPSKDLNKEIQISNIQIIIFK